MTCDVRTQLASCDVRSQLAMCGCEPTLVETCDVRACGVFLGVRCAIAISQLFTKQTIFSSDFCQNCIIFFNHMNTTTFLVENEALCVKALLSKIY